MLEQTNTQMTISGTYQEGGLIDVNMKNNRPTSGQPCNLSFRGKDIIIENDQGRIELPPEQYKLEFYNIGRFAYLSRKAGSPRVSGPRIQVRIQAEGLDLWFLPHQDDTSILEFMAVMTDNPEYRRIKLKHYGMGRIYLLAILNVFFIIGGYAIGWWIGAIIAFFIGMWIINSLTIKPVKKKNEYLASQLNIIPISDKIV